MLRSYEATILLFRQFKMGDQKILSFLVFGELALPTLSPMCISPLGKIPIAPQHRKNFVIDCRTLNVFNSVLTKIRGRAGCLRRIWKRAGSVGASISPSPAIRRARPEAEGVDVGAAACDAWNEPPAKKEIIGKNWLLQLG